MAMYTKRLQGEIYHVIEYNRYTTWHDQPLSWQNRRFSILKKKLQLTQSCKRKAKDELTERPREIIVTEGQSMETDGLNQRDKLCGGRGGNINQSYQFQEWMHSGLSLN